MPQPDPRRRYSFEFRFAGDEGWPVLIGYLDSPNERWLLVHLDAWRQADSPKYWRLLPPALAAAEAAAHLAGHGRSGVDLDGLNFVYEVNVMTNHFGRVEPSEDAPDRRGEWTRLAGTGASRALLVDAADTLTAIVSDVYVITLVRETIGGRSPQRSAKIAERWLHAFRELEHRLRLSLAEV